MKKFENPIINVSLFDVENIVTSSSETPELPKALDEAKSKAMSVAGGDANKAITITF